MPPRVLPILVTIASRSSTAWTIDAAQIHACKFSLVPRSDGKSVTGCDIGAPSRLSLPPEEAARMSPIPLMEGVADGFTQAALFATYFASIGAAGGAFAASGKGGDVSNGFTLGASYGAVIGAAASILYEIVRLGLPPESKAAGDANEKMKFLALRDRSILYSGYLSVGYVYFKSDETQGPLAIVIPFVRGDPSKDWVTGPNYTLGHKNTPTYQVIKGYSKQKHVVSQLNVATENTDKVDLDCLTGKGKCERHTQVDESPIVCECDLKLDTKCGAKMERIPETERFYCKPVDRKDFGSCQEIGDDMIVGPTPESRRASSGA